MAIRKRVDLSATKLRSAITNGSAILADVDHRSAWMRRLRDLVCAHETDLGGPDVVNESERRLIRRAAMLTLQLEMMDRKFAENEGAASTKELESYQRASNSLRRLLETLGLGRRQKDVTPTLDQYLSGRGSNRHAERAR